MMPTSSSTFGAASGAGLAWPGPLAEAGWLGERLGTPGLAVVDVRSGSALFDSGHVPGAVHGDYAAAGWRVTAEGAPGMMPPLDRLAALIGSLGIGDDSLVVLVPAGRDAGDFANAARVYWSFRMAGHDRVSILAGGFAAWCANPARPVETGPGAPPAPRPFTLRPAPALRATAAEVAAAIARGDTALVDARSAAQFRGEAKSPAARVAGTLPGAVHLDFEALYPDGGLRVPAGTVPARPGGAIAFCNTGHSAALAWFALSEVAGVPDVRLYDGSMSHWTQDPDRPVVAGTTP